jgi:pimeloyl-ACP methyl ester carboxylesterase
MLAHERSGPIGPTPVVLLHAGICDRRMWDPVWSALTADRDVVRLDLRGFGESTERPEGTWSPRADVLATLDALGIGRGHLVGCSFGAGVCVEVALERPEAVASLVLAAPGGALLTERTEDFAAFAAAEESALEAGDLDAAAEVNVVHWVDGPHRGPDVVPAAVRDAVRAMQRRAFDLAIDWPDEVWEAEDELDPGAPDRLGEVSSPTLVLCGALDLDNARSAAEATAAGVPGARLVTWPDVAHLPSMERPDDFVSLLLESLSRAEG